MPNAICWMARCKRSAGTVQASCCRGSTESAENTSGMAQFCKPQVNMVPTRCKHRDDKVLAYCRRGDGKPIVTACNGGSA